MIIIDIITKSWQTSVRAIRQDRENGTHRSLLIYLRLEKDRNTESETV